MSKDYQRAVSTVEHEIIIKNSRFIACLAPATGDDEAKQWLQDVQQRWPKASHYCTASVFGSPFSDLGLASSDDGEPSGTAGRPMLMVLKNAPIGQVTAVVVRYFGGVKLGTGGLQRAYSQAVAEALPQLQTETQVYREAFEVTYDYAEQGAIEPLWKQFDVQVVDSVFAERVAQVVAVTPGNVASLQTKLDGATQGRVQLKEHGTGLE